MNDRNQWLDLLMRAWPDGVPDGESRLLELLPPESRGVALKRLEALLDVDDRLVSVGQGAERAGLGRSAFHDLRRRWRVSRSIATAAPAIGRQPRGSDIGDERMRTVVEAGSADDDADPVVCAAWRLVGDEKSAALSNGAIGRLLVAEVGDAISLSAAVKLVQRVRQAGRLRPEVLTVTYGRSLLLDLTAVALLTAAPDVEVEPVIGSFLVERGSGLVLASWGGARRDARDGQVKTLERGLAYLRSRRADVLIEEPPRLRVILPDPGDVAESLAERLNGVVAAEDVFARGERRFGGSLVSMLGRKIDRLGLRPFSTPSGGRLPEPSRFFLREPLRPELADGMVSDFVSAHNESIERRLAGLGLWGEGGVDRGSMSLLLERVLGAFGS